MSIAFLPEERQGLVTPWVGEPFNVRVIGFDAADDRQREDYWVCIKDDGSTEWVEVPVLTFTQIRRFGDSDV